MAKIITCSKLYFWKQTIAPFITTRRQNSVSASFTTKDYATHLLQTAPSTKVVLSREDALKMYESMATIRRMENLAAELYKSRDIRGFLHLGAGQEAVNVGISASLKQGDLVITSYRCHGWCHTVGVEMRQIFGELLAKVGGISRGKGGSMHMYNDVLFGGNGIVGAQVPLGAGMALALKYLGRKNAVVTLYGDGASNQGQISETYNMAKLWSLPVLFVCENNHYGMGTSTKRHSANKGFYNMSHFTPGVKCDGMDVLAVREAARFSLDYVKSGQGPLILEVDTYRYYGHSMTDPGMSYRSREEVQSVRKKDDPLMHLKDKALEGELLQESEIKAIDNKVKAAVDTALKEAQLMKHPELEEMAADVYIKNLRPMVRGVAPWHQHPTKNHGSPMPHPAQA